MVEVIYPHVYLYKSWNYQRIRFDMALRIGGFVQANGLEYMLNPASILFFKHKQDTPYVKWRYLSSLKMKIKSKYRISRIDRPTMWIIIVMPIIKRRAIGATKNAALILVRGLLDQGQVSNNNELCSKMNTNIWCTAHDTPHTIIHTYLWFWGFRLKFPPLSLGLV